MTDTHGVHAGGRPGFRGERMRRPIVKLEVVEGPLEGHVYEFDEYDTFLCGRSSACHASVVDSYLSRIHFLMEVNPPDACLFDLGSLNGTYVNGELHGGRISTDPDPDISALARETQGDMVTIKDGDGIRAGASVFAFSVDFTEDASEDIISAAPISPKVEDTPDPLSTDDPADTANAPRTLYQAQSAVTPPTPVLIDALYGNSVNNSAVTNLPLEGLDIGRRIGRGSTGAVHFARRGDPDEDLAVKIIQPRAQVSGNKRAWFVKELSKAMGLQHLSILPMLRVAQRGDDFLVEMPYCEGGSVEDLIAVEGGRLTLRQAMSILLQVLKGLAHAHAFHLAHGGITPRNILFDKPPRQGTPRLADFRVTRAYALSGLGGLVFPTAHISQVAYMPRETFTHAREVRLESDIWSMAAVFYVMLTGRHPRHVRPGATPLQSALAEDAIPIEKRTSRVPSELASVINRALSTDYRRRYPNAEEFRHAVKGALARAGEL